MTNNAEIKQAVAERRAFLQRQKEETAYLIQTMQEQINGWDVELRELDIAEQCFERLTVSGDKRANFIGSAASRVMSDLQSPSPGKRKPPGLPTIPRMVCTVLHAEKSDGTEWMTVPELTTCIRDRWWPDVEPSDISGQVWRAAKKGKLRKEGTRYALPISKLNNENMGGRRFAGRDGDAP